jgi:hypothetical protein
LTGNKKKPEKLASKEKMAILRQTIMQTIKDKSD